MNLVAMTHVIRRDGYRSEEHTSELQPPCNLVCRLLLEKKNTACYTGILGVLAGVVTGAIERSRLLSNRTANSWEIAPKGFRPAAPGTINGFFFNDTATTEIYTLSLHDALPI